MKKLLLILAATATLFCACNKEASVEQNLGPREVKFTVSNLATFQFKAATDAINGTTPSAVGIYAAELGANNVSATVSGSALTPATTIYWGIGQTTATTFYARYPYASGAAIDGDYTLPTDQSSEDDFSYHNNVVIATTTASPSDPGVAFAFAHPFAKVFVNITNQLGGDAVASVKLKGVKLSTDNLLAPAPASAATAEDVTMYGISATQFAAIILPQTAALTIEVTTSLGSVYNFASTGTYEFASGSASAAAITLSPIGGSDSGAGKTAVSAFSFSLTDWPGTPTDRVVADGETAIGNYWHVIGCVYETANTESAWSKDFPMAYGADGKWTITINYDESMAATAGERGIKLRCFSATTAAADKWNVNRGFYSGTGDDFTLSSGDVYGELHAGGKNIRLASSGSWTLVYDPAGYDDSHPQLTVTKN